MFKRLIVVMCMSLLIGCASGHKGLISPVNVIKTDTYSLGFVEFDDSGNRKNINQFRSVLSEIKDSRSGAIILVYVHGWRHDASEIDMDVVAFKSVLKNIAASERLGRKVIGVFVGWNGGTIFNFWDRKQTVDTINLSGEVTGIIAQLNETYKRLKQNKNTENSRLIFVGHSFGARLLFQAINQPLIAIVIGSDVAFRGTSRCQDLDNISRTGAIEGFGDLVLLVNPAFEASKFSWFQRMANQECFPPSQPPILLVFSSESDLATRWMYPFARYLEGWWDDAEAKTVGNYADFQTHTLRRCPTEDKTSGTINDIRHSPLKCIGGAKLAPQKIGLASSSSAPFLVVTVDNEIIDGHNDHFSEGFISFISAYIKENDEFKTQKEMQPSVSGVESGQKHRGMMTN